MHTHQRSFANGPRDHYVWELELLLIEYRSLKRTGELNEQTLQKLTEEKLKLKERVEAVQAELTCMQLPFTWSEVVELAKKKVRL